MDDSLLIIVIISFLVMLVVGNLSTKDNMVIVFSRGNKHSMVTDRHCSIPSILRVCKGQVGSGLGIN